MLKNFLIKKMLSSKGVPEDQINMILNLMEKNPELFQKIAKEIEEKVKGGMDQTMASMSVMKKYEAELKNIM